MSTPASSRPALAVEPALVCPAEESGRWKVSWSLANRGGDTLSVLSARLPHDRFYAQERVLEPPLRLRPDRRGDLGVVVSCDEPPGAEFENAFLILRVLHGQEHWQVLVRMRIVVGPEGVPGVIQERVSAQPVGFAR